MNSRLLSLLGIVLLVSACEKKPAPVDDTTTATSGDVTFQIEHKAGSEELILDDKWYLTSNNDSIKFKKFNYYLSNFVLIGEQGKEHKIEESYVLIMESDPQSKKITFKNVPTGNYSQVKFMIGVDSLRNVSGAQTGALDPKHGMFWDWNTGYIMTMIEGESPKSSTNYLFYHIAGFKGENKVQKTVTLDLGKTITVGSSTPNIHLAADVLEAFQTPTKIDLYTTGQVLSEGTNARIIAENYADMFRVDHVD